MVFLANHRDDWPISGARIARETNVPSRYLSAILSELVRAGVLEASPGPSGGFRMARPPEKVRLVEVLSPFDGSIQGINGCPFGNETCDDESPCAGHLRWKLVKEAYIQFLQETSVCDVSMREATIELGTASLPVGKTE